jgi:Domain of unknown function (DUF3883)/EVE domain
MKLGNFSALDPAYPGFGLQSGGKRDAEIWDEFSRDPKGLAAEARRIRARAQQAPSPPVAKRQERQHWAYLAKPLIYRIEDAIDHLPSDWWPTKNKPIAVGDRVSFWRASAGSRDRRRGVIALGDVVSAPESRSEADNPFWVTPKDDVPEPRVLIRYVRPLNAPLWLGGPADPVLAALSVSRGQGTLFHVTPEQWSGLVAALGGWPDESPEVEAVRDLIDERASAPRGGQGFRVSAETRALIERHAMERAIAHYRSQGWSVEDVSATASYDLRCSRPDGQELRVEVKGTSGDGSSVLLTPNEAAHARAHYPHVALFVVAGILVSEDGAAAFLARGGVERVHEPWDIEAGLLVPVGFVHTPS